MKQALMVISVCMVFAMPIEAASKLEPIQTPLYMLPQSNGPAYGRIYFRGLRRDLKMAITQICPGERYVEYASDDVDTVFVGYSGSLSCFTLLQLVAPLDGYGHVYINDGRAP